VEFEWDPTKAEVNLRKHGVTFEFATAVFLDPDRIEELDGQHTDEERWIATGRVEQFVLVVVFTLRGEIFGSFQREREFAMSTSNTGLIRFKLDPKNPPAMTPEQLQALRDLRDEDIDLSDIPDQSKREGWRRVSDLVPEENKQQITLRLDAEVLAFFKATGKRYQSRINAALREYMLAHRAER
jgi:uncharacterized protein (DUF4415 family)/uncharacterized DUF497 family protein